ncbi:hypothetical protein ACIBO2_03905 [Nonomuraea sp. NPDC050022]|uniref:hypothetical protein n=1 Tax=Nonomuraea sp. NPDC050022 TaxID=3364358 RepID=UPI0037A0435F
MVPTAAYGGAPDTMARARVALREVVPRLVALVRSVPDPHAISVGAWTVGDVAAHLAHVFRFDTDAVAARPVPDAMVTTAGMAEVNAKMLAEDGERAPSVLADRIATLAGEFDDIAPTASGWKARRLGPSAMEAGPHALRHQPPVGPFVLVADPSPEPTGR